MSTPDTDKKSPIDALTPVSAALVEFQAEARVPTEHGSFSMKLPKVIFRSVMWSPRPCRWRPTPA